MTIGWKVIIAVGLTALLVVMMAFGFYHYPAAPIRQVGGLYVDKEGRTHSTSDFERFGVWERALVASWVGSAPSVALLRYAKRRSRG